MKKSYIFIFALLLFEFFFYTLNIVSADILPTDNLQEQVSNVQNTFGQIPRTPDEIRSAYLQKEWGAQFTAKLEKNSFGRGILMINNFIADSHLFKILLGVEYSWSWAFVFAFIIWLGFVLLFYPVFRGLLKNKIIGLLCSLIIASLIGLTGAIKNAVIVISAFVNTISYTFVALIILVFFDLIFNQIGRKSWLLIKKMREKSSKAKTQADRDILHTEAKYSKKRLDAGI